MTIALLALAACTPGEELPLGGVAVTGARLTKFDLAGFTMMAGGGAGTAELEVDAASGETFVVPVSLGFASAGLLIDLSFTTAGTVELGLPPHPVQGDDLFGRYRGSREGLVLLVGAVGHHLENDAGVRIDKTTFGFGMAIEVAAEWLTVSPDLPEETPPTDTATPPTSGPTGATGDTGGPPETGGTGTPP